ncbi:hypothetical protein RDV64_19120 [Acuticoccus sp. MNP-M23]|nr:hypothetical protein [Acuticoccus sp. MNP-M23]WMS42156.1 hypothetical protein RDV64_19120 [Acuticoccus sp. MNP-M23]
MRDTMGAITALTLLGLLMIGPLVIIMRNVDTAHVAGCVADFSCDNRVR